MKAETNYLCLTQKYLKTLHPLLPILNEHQLKNDFHLTDIYYSNGENLTKSYTLIYWYLFPYFLN